jgi:hypothetical protein
MACDSEDITTHNGGEKKAVLRAHDVIPFGDAENKCKIVIPRFDLAHEIMAEHRRVAGEKRQKAGDKQIQQRPKERNDEHIEEIAPGGEQDTALQEIVARDIARLCGIGGGAAMSFKSHCKVPL